MLDLSRFVHDAENYIGQRHQVEALRNRPQKDIETDQGLGLGSRVRSPYPGPITGSLPPLEEFHREFAERQRIARQQLEDEKVRKTRIDTYFVKLEQETAEAAQLKAPVDRQLEELFRDLCDPRDYVRRKADAIARTLLVPAPVGQPSTVDVKVVQFVTNHFLDQISLGSFAASSFMARNPDIAEKLADKFRRNAGEQRRAFGKVFWIPERYWQKLASLAFGFDRTLGHVPDGHISECHIWKKGEGKECAAILALSGLWNDDETQKFLKWKFAEVGYRWYPDLIKDPPSTVKTYAFIAKANPEFVEFLRDKEAKRNRTWGEWLRGWLSDTHNRQATFARAVLRYATERL